MQKTDYFVNSTLPLWTNPPTLGNFLFDQMIKDVQLLGYTVLMKKQKISDIFELSYIYSKTKSLIQSVPFLILTLYFSFHLCIE
jgi:hypothetical protein